MHGLTEQAGEQRHKGKTDKGNAAACDELLHPLAFRTVSERKQLFMAGGGVKVTALGPIFSF